MHWVWLIIVGLIVGALGRALHPGARELLRLLGKRLDPKAQELLSQRYLLGESTEEIAIRLEQSPTAVRMRLMRLRTMARRKSS